MVQRRGIRFGVRTPKTLRRCYMTHQKGPAEDGLLSKRVDRSKGGHFTIDEEFQQIVPDGGLALESHSRNYLVYSLNKRKRWHLPQLLKDAILEEDTIDAFPFAVSVVERAPMLVRPSLPDCLSVTRSHAAERSRRPKRRPYSFEMDLRGNRRRNGRVLPPREEEEEGQGDDTRQELEIPELIYEISYPLLFIPCPRNVRRANAFHSPEQNKEPARQRRAGRRKHADQDMKSYYLVLSHLEDQSDTSNQTSELDEFEMLEPSDKDMHLGDFIKTNVQERYRSKRRGKRFRWDQDSSGGDLKCRKYYLDDCDRYPGDPEFSQMEVMEHPRSLSESDHHKFIDGQSYDEELSQLRSPSSDSGYSDSVKTDFSFNIDEGDVPWGEVQLYSDCLEEVHLARTFEARLMDFAASEPFCVAIAVGEERMNAEDERTRRPDEVALLIQRFRIDEENNIAECRFRICDLRDVNGQPLAWKITDSTTLDPGQVYSVLDLTRLIKDTLPTAMRPTVKSSKKKLQTEGVSLETVSATLGWTYRSKHQADVVGEIKHHNEISSAKPFTTYCPCTLPIPEYCEICCGDIADSEGGGFPPIALSKCSHWFCGPCWQQYVTSRTHQGDVNISCPAMDCDTPADRITTLSLLPDALHPLYTRLEHQQLLSRQRKWEWCQNPSCGRMVAALEGARHSSSGEDHTNVIRCDCGFSWCHGCKESVHWPATCQQALEYKDYIDSKGTDTGHDLIIAVEVKRCPECDYPVQKDGGCMHMRCRFCDHEYCWECLCGWSSHDWSTPGCTIQPMESVSLAGRRKISIESYLLAASERRKARRIYDKEQASSDVFKSAINLFFKHLRTQQRNHSRPGPITMMQFEGHYTTTWINTTEERDALTDLLQAVRAAIDMYTEISFILEYLNVLIATSKTRALRRRRSGWKDSMDRLSFISLRMHSILSGQSVLKYPFYEDCLTRLMSAGRQLLEGVARAVPRVHQFLARKNRLKTKPVLKESN